LWCTCRRAAEFLLLVLAACSSHDPFYKHAVGPEKEHRDPAKGGVAARVVRPHSVTFLPAGIRKPVCFAWAAEERRFLVVTDALDLLVLDENLESVLVRRRIDALHDIVGVAGRGQGRAVLVDRDGNLVLADWKRRQAMRIERQWQTEATHAVGAAAFDGEAVTLGFAAGPQELYRQDLGGALMGTFSLSAGPDLKVLSERKLSRYRLTGMASFAGALYLYSREYNTLFLATPKGVVTEAFGLEGVHQGVDIAVRDGVIYLLAATERPRVYVVSLG